MSYYEEPSDFVRTIIEFILETEELSDHDPIVPCLTHALTLLETSLRQGGLCADISPDESDRLIKAGLAIEHPHGQIDRMHIPPLVIADKTHVYLQRDFAVECNLAHAIASFCKKENAPSAPGYPTGDGALGSDLAAVRRLALNQSFSVIFGGPGTGKTTCLAGILETLFEKSPNLVVYLAAPTGKAAARMREALESSVKTRSEDFSNLAKRLKQTGALSLPTRTLHRWLYALQDSGERPSKASPLNCDLFVLDEASMLDAQLAEKLLRVLNPRKTRLILLGDPFQLRSVGPGSVFADLCALGRTGGFAGELKHSFRFDPTSGVGKIAHAVNKLARQETEENRFSEISEPAHVCPGVALEPVHFYLSGSIDSSLFSLLGLPQHPDRLLYSLSSDCETDSQSLPAPLKQWIDTRIRSFAQVLLQGDENAVIDQAQRFRILCAMREGPVGINAVNTYASRILQSLLAEKGLTDKPDAGRMIIIRKNDDDLGLYNGDMGVILPGEPGSVTQALFPGGIDGLRHVALSLLPEYDTAFAITIHQSQGSEYEDIALVLPTQPLEGSASEDLVTNELVYTGITRVKDTKDSDHRITAYGKLSVFSGCDVLKNALVRLSERKTGFKMRLAEAINA